MIIISFIDWLTTIFSGTNINFTYDSSWVTAIMDIISFVSWVIPLDSILFCFGVSLAILSARIIVAIWKLLPLT